MKIQVVACAGAALALGTLALGVRAYEDHPVAQVKGAALMSKDLPEYPGKEAVMSVVEYPPGTASPPHPRTRAASHMTASTPVRIAGRAILAR